MADIQVEVVNTKFAVLDVNFLLESVSNIIDFSFALLRGILSHDSILCHF